MPGQQSRLVRMRYKPAPNVQPNPPKCRKNQCTKVKPKHGTEEEKPCLTTGLTNNCSLVMRRCAAIKQAACFFDYSFGFGASSVVIMSSRMSDAASLR